MTLSNNLQHTNHEISLEDAIEMTTRFREEIQSMFKPEFSAIGILPISETFNKSIFEDLVMQPECVAVRSYFGMDENNEVRLLFVGVDENNNDILVGIDEQPAYIFEYGQRCPPICAASPLNPQI
jgi:hypothetical protein